MGSYPVFAKVNFERLQQFKEEFKVNNASDLELVLRLQRILDCEHLLFDEIEEFGSKSYWTEVLQMPCSEIDVDDEYLRFIKFRDLVDFLLPSESLRQEIAQMVNDLNLDTDDRSIKDIVDFINDYDKLETCEKKAYYVGNLASVLSVIRQKSLSEKYKDFYKLDVGYLIEKMGFNKFDMIRSLVRRDLAEDDLLVVYGVSLSSRK